MGAQLADLPFSIVRLAALTIAAVGAGTDAFVAGDLSDAQGVIDDDDAIDALRHTIEDDCLALLGGGGLADADLRFVVATLRVAHELERSADLMVNVAKTVERLSPHPLDSTSAQLVERMGRQAEVQLRVAVNAFADRDSSWAAALTDMDGAMDELERRLFHHILGTRVPTSNGSGVGDDAVVVPAVQLGLVARHYERIGDHAVTIAEQVDLVVTGTRRARQRSAAITVG